MQNRRVSSYARTYPFGTSGVAASVIASRRTPDHFGAPEMPKRGLGRPIWQWILCAAAVVFLFGILAVSMRVKLSGATKSLQAANSLLQHTQELIDAKQSEYDRARDPDRIRALAANHLGMRAQPKEKGDTRELSRPPTSVLTSLNVAGL
ncbi:hypothetical protein FACS1894196_0330 [Clostridia bacterium]|nr:hypothetical protein FACS1894196_0330 [Clostridia bacterium]